MPTATAYFAVYFGLLTNLWKVFSKKSSDKYREENGTGTVSRTERKVFFPRKLSTIDLDDGLCDGVSSDSREFECMPCMVGVLPS